MAATRTVTLTHKGWLGLCPVYAGAIESACPDVHERHWMFAPLMWVSLAIFGLLFALAEIVDPHFEAEWPLKLTGKLAHPLSMVLPGLEQV